MKIKNEYITAAAENIALYFEKEASISERAGANLRELALYAANSAYRDIKNGDFYSLGGQISPYLPNMPDAPSFSQGAIDENSAFVNAKLSLSQAVYYAEFCKRVAEELSRNSRVKLSPLLFAETAKKNGGRVAFTESNIIREAFDKFAKRANGLTAAYVSSFTDACEDTAADLSQFCILPIENSTEGILTSIYSLIGRYELFICGVCEISRDGHSTKFALLCPDACDIIGYRGEESVTLRLYGDGEFLMSKVYLGASFFGISAGGSVSVPLGYTDGYASVCTFTGGADALFAFLLYLGMMKIGYTLVGAYNVIE
ncbi:MAG: hypothetical protein IIX18_03220 [Clostridia bacterium]|nr:hypothetical protein [Clostridia bacterium]MBQ6614311.1 hypothetical protein [Clostridia bacterium]